MYGSPPEYDVRLEFDPDGRLISYPSSSPDAVTALSTAEEGFHGPRFTFRTDGGTHQGGWHVHAYERARGGYALTDVCFTRDGPTIIAYRHCEGKSPVKIDSLSAHAVERLARDGLAAILEKDREWTRTVDPDKVIATFPLTG